MKRIIEIEMRERENKKKQNSSFSKHEIPILKL